MILVGTVYFKLSVQFFPLLNEDNDMDLAGLLGSVNEIPRIQCLVPCLAQMSSPGMSAFFPLISCHAPFPGSQLTPVTNLP